MYWPHGGPERFRLKPIPLPEGNEGFAQRMRTVNLLTDVFWKLGVQNRFMLRRGNPLQLTVVGDGRPEEFVATQRFFGESSNLEIIEIDSSTHETARLMHEVLIEDISERTGIRFTPAIYTKNDVFAQGVLKPDRHVIVGFGLHPNVVAGGGIDLFADHLAPNGVMILTKRSDIGISELMEKINERIAKKGDLELISQGYLHLDQQTYQEVSIQNTPDPNFRYYAPVDFPDNFAVALRKKTPAEIGQG